MPFAPHEIENKRFVVALRGYQTEEVDAFLRAVAADYRAALEQASGETASEAMVAEVAELQRIVQTTRDEAEREAAELRAAVERAATELRDSAQADAAQIRAAAQTSAADLRIAAQAHAGTLREEAEAEAAEIRARAQAEAAEIRDAAFREAEAAYAEIAVRADELRRLEAALWNRVHVLEHTVVECRQTLAHVSGLQPMPAVSGPSSLPSVDELLYRVEESLTRETNAEVATPLL